MASTPVAVRLADPLKARIRALADQRRRPMHWLMREAIEQYVTREEKREAFRQEAIVLIQGRLDNRAKQY